VWDVEFRSAPMVGKDLSCRPQVVLGYGPATAVQPLWNPKRVNEAHFYSVSPYLHQNNSSVDYPAAEPSSREGGLSGALMNGVHVGHLAFRSTWSAGEHSYWQAMSVLPVLVLAPEGYHHPALVGSPEGRKFHVTLATSSSLNLPAQAQRCEVVNEALQMNSTKYLRGWANLGEPSLFIIELKANIRHHRRPDFWWQDAL
jgi:hypothetical protein